MVKYSDGRIAMFDVFTGQKSNRHFGSDWEEAIKQCERLLYVPNWFSGEFFSIFKNFTKTPYVYTNVFFMIEILKLRTLGIQ